MLPMYYETEEEAIETAIESLGPKIKQKSIIIVQIPNTLHLNRIYVSSSVLKELEKTDRKFKIKGSQKLIFNQNGDLLNKFSLKTHS